MKLRTFGKICFSFFLMLALMVPNVLPFSAQYARAQNANAGGNATAGAGASTSVGFNAGGLLGSALVCSGVIDKLVGAISGLFSSAVPTEVPVGDKTLRTKENCMDAVVHQLVVLILDKITLATVDWINSGFEGQPLYLSDPEQFFHNVAKSEIDRLTGWYGCTTGSTVCTTDYPFGQLVMTSIISTIQSQLAANVRFSLNQVLAHGTYEEYALNFNVGGWAGYTAFLEPNNNIFGNTLLVNQELGRRIGGTSLTASANFSQQLTQSGGFLNQRRCVMTGTGDPQDVYIKETDPLHVPEGGPIPQALATAIGMQTPYDVPDENQQLSIDEYTLRSQCKEWRTTTPGNIIGSKITSALNISDNKLIHADEISESLGLIFDALINQLAQTGLESMSSFFVGDNGGGGSESVLVQQVNGQQPGQIQNGQTPPPVVDVVTGTGFADTELVVVQNNFTNQANLALPVLDRLIKKVRALDYCVPGPNPNWLTNAQTNFSAALQSVVPFVSTNPDPGDAEDENRAYYAAAINTLSGVNIVESASMHNHTQFLAFMNNLFAKYAAKMQDVSDMGYNRFLAPPSTRVLVAGFLEDAASYQASYDTLNEYLTNIPSYLPILLDIEAAFDLIAQQNGGQIDPNSPEVEAQVSLFNSISDHFATEDQLSVLTSSYASWQAEEAALNGHLNSCLDETVNAPYQPDQRVMYPTPILPTYGQASPPEITTLMPNPDAAFLPGVDFDDTTNGENIDISFGGVGIIGTEPLAIFEAVLQSVY